SFNARSNVGHFTECQQFLTSLPTHGPNNDQPRMNAEMESQLNTLSSLQASIQVSYGIEDTQARPYGSVGIIFVCLGIAKVHQKAIAKVLGDMSIKACDDLSTDLLIRSYPLPVLFGVELGGECGGIDQITEHHSELAPFRFRRMGYGWCGLT